MSQALDGIPPSQGILDYEANGIKWEDIGDA